MTGFDFAGSFAPAAATTLTIASGVITVKQMKHIVAAQTGTADDLDTITVDSTIGSGYEGVLLLYADSGDTITLKHGTGNIVLAGGLDISLSGNSSVLLMYDGINWRAVYGDAPASVILAQGQETSNAATVVISGWTNPGWAPSEFELVVTGLETDRAANYWDNVLITFNADATAANYNSHYISGAGDAVTTLDYVGSQVGINLTAVAAGATSDSGCFGIITLKIRLPLGTSDKKHILYTGSVAAETNDEYVYTQGGGHWESTAAITSITLTPDNGTTFEVGGAGEPTTLDWVLKAHR